MQLHRDAQPDANLITGLDDEGLRIGQRLYTSSLIVSAEAIVETWHKSSVAELTADDWADALALNPELMLLGTGATLTFPAPDVLAPLLAKGVGVEVMDTPAACRTYNLLLSEGRRAVAALLPANG